MRLPRKPARRGRAADRIRSEQLRTVLEAMAAFLDEAGVRAVGDILLRAMLRWTSSQAGFLGLVDDLHCVRILSGGLPGVPSALTIPASPILGRAFQRREVVCSARPDLDFPGDILLGSAPPVRNFLLVPVHSGEEPLAVAFVANRIGRFSRDDHARMLLPARVFGAVLKSGRERDRRNVVESRLRLAEKMEAVGRLAGGVAHDFNNLLTTVLGQCEMLRCKLGGQDTLFSELGEIRGAGERAASITRQLLAFGRKQPVQPKILVLNDIVRGMTKELQAMVGKGIEVRAILAPSLWTVLADRAQMGQVLVDLALNARDAMPGGGKLTLETSNVELDSSYVQEHPSAVAGPHVAMRIADTGAGMAPEILGHVFEPYFTTKGRGNARGLGLATVYGVVKQSGGSIAVDSRPGEGTTIRIFLPRQEGEVKESLEGEIGGDVRGEERVLLVEDDVMVRRLVRETLRSRGYQVVDAGSAEDALQFLENEIRPVDLLLTDLVMPGMGGRRLAELLKARWPGLPVLYMSGYSEDMAFRHGRLEPDAAFLPKPFSVEELLAKVRRVIRTRA
jgi:two-component system, cell cycle sensor histidine kinase and response regulator CckA